MNDPLWDKIDDKLMYPVARILNDAGIVTFACCDGHGKGWPWMNCRVSEDYGEKDIIDVLMKHGYVGFSVMNVRYVNRRENPIREGEKYHFWRLEFWADDFLTKGEGE